MSLNITVENVVKLLNANEKSKVIKVLEDKMTL